MKRFITITAAVLAIGLSTVTSPTACGQLFKRTPTHADLPYDDQHDAQKMDVYLTESKDVVPVVVFFHGGGWHEGSKKQVPPWLIQGVRRGDYSVVSVEYRFTDVAPHPAQAHDCVRAIQVIRHNAAAWKIDPDRMAVTGGSAGGHLSLWVALHDDSARPDSDDPVERYSSRVTCAISFAGPTDFSLLDDVRRKNPAYRRLLRDPSASDSDEIDDNVLKDASPVSFATPDDPPILQIHGDSDNIVPAEHARTLHTRLEEIGVRSELVMIEHGTHLVAFALPNVTERADAFVQELLLKPGSEE